MEPSWWCPSSILEVTEKTLFCLRGGQPQCPILDTRGLCDFSSQCLASPDWSEELLLGAANSQQGTNHSNRSSVAVQWLAIGTTIRASHQLLLLVSIYVPLNIWINAKVQNPKSVIFAYHKEHSVYTSQQIHVWVIMGCSEKSQQLETHEHEGTKVVLRRQKWTHSARCWPTSTFQCWWKRIGMWWKTEKKTKLDEIR